MEEIWKDITGYEGVYQISDYGNVKSLNYHRENKEQILKPRIGRHGYMHIDLHKKNKVKTFRVHRLVAWHFIPNVENKSQVNHKDFNKTNNCASNLEWCSDLENKQHAQKAGKYTEHGKQNKGKNNGRAKLRESDVKFMRYLHNKFNLSQKRLSELFDVTDGTISLILNKKIWKHV